MKELPLNQVLCGDCREVMKTFPDDCIDLVVTSPPYWGLRDYGTGKDQLGLEDNPQLFINNLAEIALDIKRILKPTGSFWLNLGDTYYASGGYGSQYERFSPNKENPLPYKQNSRTRSNWLKPKQLLGMPWRVAIALQEQGWVLRNCVIWHKPNHMPSSVKDRLTPSYEFFFFFVKARKYYFDLDTIRQPYSKVSIARVTQPNVMNQKGGDKQRQLRGEGGGNASRSADMVKSVAKRHHGSMVGLKYIENKIGSPYGKNPGDLWTIPTYPFPAAHFATFPMKLIDPIIKSASPPKVCISCGLPQEKIFESIPPEGGYKFERNVGGRTDGFSSRMGKTEEITAIRTLVGYTDCGCGSGFVPGVVLDPFCGSGTALRVARKLRRSFIGIDIKEEYCEMARRRVKKDRYKEIPENVVPLSVIFEDEST